MHAFNVTTQPQINHGPVTTWPTHNDVHTNTNNQENVSDRLIPIYIFSLSFAILVRIEFSAQQESTQCRTQSHSHTLDASPVGATLCGCARLGT